MKGINQQSDALNDWRRQIDKLDEEMLRLLAKRIKTVRQVGNYKHEHKLPPLDEKRWNTLLENLCRKGEKLHIKKPLIQELFNLIHEYAIREEKRLTRDTKTIIFGIQGGRGSFNDEAIHYYLKRNNLTKAEIVYLYTTANVLRAVNTGDCDYGLFAIHNSAGGVVTESIDAMGKDRFTIAEDFAIIISHALMIRKDANLHDITTIMSHPQALAQCKLSLTRKYPHLRQTSGKNELIDTALAAKELGEGKLPKHTAVLGNKLLAELYNLDIVEENLQDLQQNYTSFLLVKRP